MYTPKSNNNTDIQNIFDLKIGFIYFKFLNIQINPSTGYSQNKG
jgi:hypothetical protein